MSEVIHDDSKRLELFTCCIYQYRYLIEETSIWLLNVSTERLITMRCGSLFQSDIIQEKNDCCLCLVLQALSTCCDHIMLCLLFFTNFILQFFRSENTRTPLHVHISFYVIMTISVQKIKTYSERVETCTHPLVKQLYSIMEVKKSNLALSVDLTNSQQILQVNTSNRLFDTNFQIFRSILTTTC